MAQKIQLFTYTQITRSVRVSVTPMYVEEESKPGEHINVWSYRVFIENIGNQTVQLLDRYWRIIDAQGLVQEVSGPGVVGKQPILGPGEAFEYRSGVTLATDSGLMMGNYQMAKVDTGETFTVAIPAFSLDSPHDLARPN